MLSEHLGPSTQVLGYIAGLSGLMLVLAILLLPLFVAAIPDNYFDQEKRMGLDPSRPAILIWLFRALKNILGLVLILAGLLMLLLPGQGILTILVGMMLMNYPGKYRLERKLVSQPRVLALVNWLRRRRNKKEFRFEGL